MNTENAILSTNLEKAASRVAINGVMLACVFVVVAIIFAELDKFNPIAVIQLLLSIPLLFISSLAYSKIGYWKETKLWDSLGYLTTTLGNYFLINAMGITASRISKLFAFIYFGTTIVLILTYSIINIIYTHALGKQIFKFLLASAILFFGGILPLLL